MQITIPYSFHVWVWREGEKKKITIIQCDLNPKCFSKATSISEPGQEKKNSYIPGSVCGMSRKVEMKIHNKALSLPLYI